MAVLNTWAPGETFAKNITLAGTGSNYIAANGNGALTLSGNITATGATSTLRLIGQTGGYFNPLTNQITGVIFRWHKCAFHRHAQHGE